MKDKVKEIVAYTIKAEYRNEAPRLFKEAQQIISTLPGFISIQTVQSIDDDLSFIDLVEWESVSNALNAQKTVAEDERFSSFLALFSQIKFCEHFTPFHLN